MDIKVGEYVRTYDGEIFRITGKRRYKDRILYLTNSFGQYSELVMQEIVRVHSKRQEDLIFEGDILKYKTHNSPKFIEYSEVKEYPYAHKEGKYLGVNGWNFEQITIIKILTKEQFEQNCYEMEV